MPRDRVNWAQVKARWTSGEYSNQISKDYPVSRQAIDKRAKKEGWARDGEDGCTTATGGWLQVAQGMSIAKTVAGSAIGKRSPEKIAAILQHLSDGVSEKISAMANGIDPSTLTRWKAESAELAHAVEAAKSQSAAEAIKRIQEAGKRGDWKADAYLLERNPVTRDEFSSKGFGSGVNIILNIQRESVNADGVTIDAESA